MRTPSNIPTIELLSPGLHRVGLEHGHIYYSHGVPIAFRNWTGLAPDRLVSQGPDDSNADHVTHVAKEIDVDWGDYLTHDDFLAKLANMVTVMVSSNGSATTREIPT